MKTKYKLISILNWPINFIENLLNKNIDPMTDVQTLTYILKNHCSIARYGDGEIQLMRNIPISFQKNDKKLMTRLKEIASNPNDNCLVCVPSTIGVNNPFENINEDAKKTWKLNRFFFIGFWKKYFKNHKILGNSLLTRFYLDKEDKSNIQNYLFLLRKIWDKRNILIVEGKGTNLGEGNSLFENAFIKNRLVYRSSNAFEEYDKILKETLASSSKDDLILIALGPTATVLAYDLSIMNRQALDIGHLDVEYMWYLKGAQDKIKIEGRNVNEQSFR